MRALERVLKACGNQRRLLILQEIKRHRERSVGVLAKHVRLSIQTTSKHIAVLSAANIIVPKRSGMNVFYRIADDLPTAAKRVLDLL